ncbi:MAG: hypothetical protein K6A34_04110 [Methanobrevibacter sp.]|nr:hypothetical protein [Methanobrevibacter sp.]
MPIDKEQIKSELVDESNKILETYNEPYRVDGISVMNVKGKVTFLGSLRVFDERLVNNVKKDVESKLKKYGKLTLRDERVVPCCSPKYTHISFNIVVDDS